MKIRTVVVLIVWIAVLLGIQVGYALFLLPQIGIAAADRGLFGDSFGAFNAFISGCAFICLLISLRQQEKHLVENQKEIEREISLLTKQATSSENATAALTRQLALMQLSSRLSAIPTLVEAELVHLEAHHAQELGKARIRSMTHHAIAILLANAEAEMKILSNFHQNPSSPIPATCHLILHQPPLGHFKCAPFTSSNEICSNSIASWRGQRH
jgi:hypothetical protein